MLQLVVEIPEDMCLVLLLRVAGFVLSSFTKQFHFISLSVYKYLFVLSLHVAILGILLVL